MFHMLDLFFKYNDNLTECEVSECDLGAECIRQLSLALGKCSTSLKRIKLDRNQIEGGQLVDIIVSLSMHPKLEVLDL